MEAAKVAGVVLGGALLVIVVLALLEVARRKTWPDPVARLANVIYTPGGA